jgi:acyl-CoA dehydrogenase
MALQTIDTEFMHQYPELARLHDRLRAFGPQADAIANIPQGMLDGIDVRSLNCNGFEHDAQPASTIAERCRVFELLGHADPALAVALPGPSLTLSILKTLASPKQRNRVLSILQSDAPKWGAFAMTEPRSGSDATHLAVTARPVPGGYLLNGAKCYIGNAGRADYVVVFASIDPKKGQFGIRAFLLEMPSAGLSIDDNTGMLGLRAVRVSRLKFENCFVAEESLLGHGTQIDPARTFSFAQTSFDCMRPCLSSLIVGASFGVIDHLQNLTTPSGILRSSIEALTEQFAGPLSSARMLCRNAAELMDNKTGSSASSSICKLYATELACTLIDRAMLLPGLANHEAFTTLTRLHRDFQAFRMMEGTSDVHRLMIARDRNILHRKIEAHSSDAVIQATARRVA